MEFVMVMILGAAVGVLVDRLWRRVESRTKVRIQGGPFRQIGNEEGISLTITNIGSCEIPSFRISLFNPLAGNFYLFTRRNGDGPLLPKQQAEFALTLLKDGRAVRLFDLSRRGDEQPMTEAERDQYRFRLVLANSDESLFENRRIGRSLARFVIGVLSTHTMQGLSKEAWAWMYPHENAFRPVERIRERLAVRKILREHKAKSGASVAASSEQDKTAVQK